MSTHPPAKKLSSSTSTSSGSTGITVVGRNFSTPTTPRIRSQVQSSLSAECVTNSSKAQKSTSGTKETNIASKKGKSHPKLVQSSNNNTPKKLDNLKNYKETQKANQRSEIIEIRRAQLYIWNMALKEAAEKEWASNSGGNIEGSANDGV
eukprot:Tbor_TRINITY_DN3914_c0_g1::TRINITY_DN3914_c0_g1_i1::g.752::m.752